MNLQFENSTINNLSDLVNQVNKNWIGADELFYKFFHDTGVVFNPSGYPPYNIEKVDDNSYKLTLAVAGFTEKTLSINLHKGMLKIEGAKDSSNKDAYYIYKGIGSRAFVRQFQLADNIEVKEVVLENGLLNIKLLRNVSEEEKPKNIPISSEKNNLSINEE